MLSTAPKPPNWVQKCRPQTAVIMMLVHTDASTYGVTRILDSLSSEKGDEGQADESGPDQIA
jgi:hypothetical protein